jgi:hypothetical protein
LPVSTIIIDYDSIGLDISFDDLPITIPHMALSSGILDAKYFSPFNKYPPSVGVIVN